jgi:methyl-accepting chemotaxis protein
VEEVLAAISRLAAQASQTQTAVVDGRDRVQDFLAMSSEVLDGATRLGVETRDTPFISLAVATAWKIALVFSDALDDGRVTESVLFDTHYRRIPGTDPEQYLTDIVEFADSALPRVQEPVLGVDPRIVFCAAMDRNGYIPTHNAMYSAPQGHDASWNRANARNRTIYRDATAQRAAANDTDYVLQIYRRLMGPGQYHVMKEASAPIVVRSRHWGALRIGFREHEK